jgi:peptidoglycan/xylan/chitin deacetylase (PgdA/CDA1 family)
VTKNLSASTLIDNVMANIKQNTKNKIDSTVLMHDLTTKHNTVEALEPLIQTLKEQGYVMDKALDESVKPVQQKVIE